MMRMLDYYLTMMRIAVISQFQYRVSNYFYMLGLITEPIIYLVVWSTIASSSGGMVGGYTAGQIAAYYIVWTLVRSVNVVLTPYAWEFRIQHGELSALLLRPQHPINQDLAYFAGWKIVTIVLWLPIAAVLSLIFRPSFATSPLNIAAFVLAITGAYLIRSVFLWILGLITLWTTRVSAIYELYFSIELLISGRLVPLSFMPPWVQTVANFFPFQWCFSFPINVLIGKLSPTQLLQGLLIQLGWIIGGFLVMQLVWRSGVRRFGAVGN